MKALLFLLLLAPGFETEAQDSVNPCINHFKFDVEKDEKNKSSTSTGYFLKEKSLEIVFEQIFNDSIVVLRDNKIIKKCLIKTDPFLGVSRTTINVDYSKLKKVPIISIVLPGRNDCISFRPRADKRIAYVNFQDNAWGVVLSNELREYR